MRGKRRLTSMGQKSKDDNKPKTATALEKILTFMMIPGPIAWGMLILGADRDFEESIAMAATGRRLSKPYCYFPLPDYLVIGGTISLSYLAMEAICRNLVLGLFRVSPKLDKPLRRSLDGLRVIMTVFSLCQPCLILAGTILILPQIGTVSYDKTSAYYCKQGPYLFSFALLITCWCNIIILFSSFFYIRYSSRAREGKRQIAFKSKF